MKKIKLKSRPNNKEEHGEHIKNEAKKITWKSVLNILLMIAIAGVSIILIFALYIVISSPNFDKEKLYQKEPSILYDRNGKEFARVGAENSTVITYDEIPNVLVDALVATEDSRFFQHSGLDLFRFIKASFGQLVGSGTAGGASTLSMQVMKRTYNGSEDEGIAGIIRKFRDIYMAVFKLEAKYTKEEIIEFYLNSQWFANDGNINYNGIVGIEQASLYYFGKSSKDLNLAEASLLAGMFQNPYRYRPYSKPEECRTRQKTVLKLMVRHGYITEDEMNDVLAIPIESMLVEQKNVNNTIEVDSNQAFVDYVVQEIQDDLKLNPRNVSLKIYTTFDPDVQKYLENVENGDVHAYIDDTIQEGIAVTSVEDGSIVALSGGRDYKAKGTNFATGIRRQPGSTAKPIFDYAMYIENISQSTYAMLLDEKTTYSNGQSINDYDNRTKGLITMRYALQDSRNIPALRAFKAVANIDKKIIEDFVHSVGIDYGEELFESASIGGIDCASPLQMSAAYASFGRGGYYIAPYGYTKIINNETGKQINHSYNKEKVMEESTAYLMNNILDSVYGGGNIAGKTGTTNLDSTTKKNYGLPGGAISDSWIISYSTKYSISFWYGYESLQKASEAYKIAKENKKSTYFNSSTGGSMRTSVMKYLAKNIHKGIKSWKVPKNITTANIEQETFPAQLCSAYTPSNLCKTEYFVAGAEPTEVSSRYDTLENPTNASYTLNGSTITLKWDPIATPDAINPEYLQKHFEKYYEEYAEKYYNNRISYNNSNIGSIGYEVTVKTPNGTEQSLGWTNNPTITFNAPVGGEYTFTIRSAYSIFKANKSSGLVYKVKTIDSNIGDIVGDDNDDSNNQTNPPTDIPATPTPDDDEGLN